jgi:hypothetical protein
MNDSDKAGEKDSGDPWGLMADLDDVVGRGDAKTLAALIRAGADTEAVGELEDPKHLAQPRKKCKDCSSSSRQRFSGTKCYWGTSPYSYGREV